MTNYHMQQTFQNCSYYMHKWAPIRACKIHETELFLYIRATIVEHFTTFYTNVESATLTYNASCVAGNTLMDTRSGAASFASSLTFILGSLMFVALTL